jgi:hypothetical protein
MKLPPEVAGFDSASAMVVALARFLHGQDTPPLGKPAFRALRPVAQGVSQGTRTVDDLRQAARQGGSDPAGAEGADRPSGA